LRSETSSPPSTQAEAALISPVSFECFLSNWNHGTQAVPTPTYHAGNSNSNSRSSSPHSSQGQDASGRSGQQHTEENSYTEMDSRRDCEHDSAVQMVSDGVSVPAQHSTDCDSDSDSQRQRKQVNLLLYCCYVVFVYLLSVCCPSIPLSLSSSIQISLSITHYLSVCLPASQPVCVVGRTYQ
jgi:hypothetical protein